LREIQTEIAIIGGGVGGVAAALAALRMGRRVILTEETDWIGGQFTSQAVPPDEGAWIEQFGCTRSYRQFRDDVREWYRRWYPLTNEARQTRALNPGGGWVSQLCAEPRVALGVLQAYLLPFETSGQLQILTQSTPVAASSDGDRVSSVTLRDARDGEEIVLRAPYFLDATELGELLELANIESVIGAESQAQTGEPHAPAEAQPLNQQSITYCFAMSHHEGENHVIAKPQEYSFWQNYKAGFWPDKNLSWQQTHPITLATRHRSLFPTPDSDAWEPLWNFRRIVGSENFSVAMPAVTLVNWPQIDYWLGPLTGVSEEEKQKHLHGARQLSLCFLYWMQTEAPRHDGGNGYPGLKIRGDITGTKSGLAKYPYIRESRRIQAEFTVCEQHVAEALRPDGAEKFPDSVGIGSYRIDLHPSTGKSGDGSDGDNYIDVGSWPFQIPLGSLVPVRAENLLPACKNLGVTHITNGCYRLHPVEWNIGEAAGVLAAHCLEISETPRGVRNTSRKLEAFQKLLAQQGFELDWPVLHAA
jgi:hypothetical protein